MFMHEIEKIKQFHGHAGIWVALGYKAGLLAKERLKPIEMKEMEAKIEIPYKTPYSCFLDGIQLSSCCTTGKCNLFFENSNHIKAFFNNKKSGQKLIVSLSTKLLKEINEMENNKLLTHENEENNTKWILSKKDSELFEIKP